MHIKNETYFHIHRIGPWSDRWKVGSTIFWGQKEINNFNRWYDNNVLAKDFNDGAGMFSAKAALNKFLSFQRDYQNNNYEGIINFAYEVINEQSMFIRESLFEEVRKNYFPNLPSRKTCIWICEENAVEYWWKRLHGDKINHKILQIEVTGTLHKADQKHLINDTLSHNKIRTNAFNYWTGTDGNNPLEEELLFEGVIKVLNEWNNIKEINSSNG